ncbi:MAG TPA: phage terminase large subunit [Nitrospira sp.]|nr:phage terminase large subunit [Nitrospira sp.]
MNRRSIRRSLTEYARYKGFEPAQHHKLLISELEKVARRETRRLAVFMPPGSAKSTYASILFPPWLMQYWLNTSVLAASHTTELAEKWGRRVRNAVNDDGLVLGIGISADNQAAGRWALTTGAEYYAAGVGTGIAGFRAGLGMIDDPIRSRQDADSELIRDRIWEWYINDFRTRLVPGAPEILIQTRWHEDDLAGRALQHNDWRVVSLPAEAEPNDPLGRKVGEFLWADGDYGYAEQLAELKKNTPARTWSALYQQRPAPEDGDYFKAEWLKPYDKAPALDTLRVYGGSDYAVTADGGDYTVHAVVGLDPEGRMYLLDLWRKQASSDQWIESFCDMVLQWRPMSWAEEQGQIKSGVGPFLERRMRERRAYTVREQFPTRGDKAIRAQSIRSSMAMNGLYVPMNAPWYADLRSELLSFPAGKHDDQVDALGLVGQLLDRMQAGVKAKSQESKPRDRWDAVFDDDGDELNWKTA